MYGQSERFSIKIVNKDERFHGEHSLITRKEVNFLEETIYQRA